MNNTLITFQKPKQSRYIPSSKGTWQHTRLKWVAILILVGLVFMVSICFYFISLSSYFSSQCICDKGGIKDTMWRCCYGSNQAIHLDVRNIPHHLQRRSVDQRRFGAQVCANQTMLDGTPSRLVWSHVGPDSFLDGVNHVTHFYRESAFDCLESTADDLYLISIQLTYRYNATFPSEAVKSYFTLTKFSGVITVVAKIDTMIPPPRKRYNTTVKQPVVMVRSEQLIKGDRLCVTVSHPELIYASQIDNFFGMFSL